MRSTHHAAIETSTSTSGLTSPQKQRQKRILNLLWPLAALLVLFLAGCQPMPPAAAPTASAATTGPAIAPRNDAEKIVNAMSAAPMSVAKNATVLDWPAEKGATPNKLREGTNGWVCRPDDPASPINDPRCFDPNWLALFGKAYTDRDANASFGVSYMLQGGSVAANDMPTMTMPMAGTGWQVDPPHLMVVLPIPWDQSVYSSAHTSGGPWIMYKDSASEHLMVPIFAVQSVAKGDDKIANALSAGPLSITGEAAVMDYPAAGSTDLVELRPGTNGWTCIPDDPTTPTNDPMCVDGVWLQWTKDFLAGKEPHPTDFGFSYMLQGGSVADNNDPTLTEPAAGKDWQVDPPHVMILSPDPLDAKAYPTTMTDTGPWIMWAGTPFEHLMFPVEDAAMPESEAGAAAMPENEASDDKIANALSAAPESITANAAVMDWPSEAGGTLTELRPGTNGWTCLPDNPTNPANDPACVDAPWLEWFTEYLAGEEPTVSAVGYAYMLQGGSVADNDDPSLTEPAAGKDWQVDPPHVMVVSPEPLDPSVYTNDMHAGGPWVMWGGTPFEHLMVPVESVPLESEAGDDKIANALSAAPASITANAAVMDWPSEAGGTLTELRPGTNGWTCLPDNPTNPANDPACVDAPWLEWFTEYLAGEEPTVSAVGYAYMLQGGSVADNDDPSLTEPAAGKDWQVDPPHVMVVSPEPLDPSVYTNDMHAGGPWVMWGGTPFEHLMVPVEDAAMPMK